MSPFARSPGPRFDSAPFRLSGTIYGSLLNSRAVLDSLGAAVQQPPYKGAPRSVVLFLKPPNTIVAAGEPILVDADVPELEVAGQLGLVLGRTACAVREAEALAHVAGYIVVADFSAPHEMHFRPQVRFKARDASCALGPRVVPAERIADPDALAIRVRVDGRLAQQGSTGDRVRSAARLLADVTEFMTLSPGDILMTGALTDPPRVRAGARVEIDIDGLERLETRVAEAGSPRP
ncbi:MAG TPA: fumarylacetoacetate hydrolase family protein [Caldimonas sp.]|jgi:5-oxopent-3-ene-1,2,5-tricarboxylate decarboxylase/2-hydroxyhepta-2,4-diene-1,7-dioate isomerase|nr:fumarylacetoacetate hydrolase family protein [Caldimonas sp.]HEX2539587.1 fumarylacetoacetate hydrolase family protein [Caldimonas sp.]